jgi:chromate transport protein ChrA
MPHKTTLKEIAKLFLKLGAIGFGGPAAHIAMMRHEVVVKKVVVRTTFFRPNRGNKLLSGA